LYCDADNNHCSVVLAQQGEDCLKVNAIAGRKLTISEEKLPYLEKILLAALWGYKRLGRYCYYLPKVTVVLKSPAQLRTVLKNDVPVHLMSQLIELSSLRVDFGSGVGAYDLQQSFIQDLLETKPTSTVECPSWKHEDINIELPTGDACAVPGECQVMVHFDGACSKKLGAGGFVIR
jgi:hypothetical protein